MGENCFNKTTATLYIYDQIVNRTGRESIKQLALDLGCKEYSVLRYVTEIKNYCCDFYADFTIEFDRVSKMYKKVSKKD